MTTDFTHAFRFGGLDRAAHLRADESQAAHPDARCYVFWRGKLLVDPQSQPVLAPLAHSALTQGRDAPLFVGLMDGVPRFAADLTFWAPPEDAATIGQFVDTSRQLHPDFPDAHFAEVRALMTALTALDGEGVATARALIGWHGTHRFCANCGAESRVELRGWQRRCPQCASQHFPRTDPVVIMAITRNDRLLLGRGTTWPERMYSLLAGFVEPGETIEAAVRRETREEASVIVGAVRYVAAQPWPFPMSLMFGCVGEALSEEITLDPAELADARWLSRDEVRAMLAGTHAEIAAPRAGAIAGAIMSAWCEDRLEAMTAAN